MMRTYAIRCTETGRYKIGQTTKGMERFKAIQANSPTRLEFVGWLDLPEREIHAMLAGHRMHGEWFCDYDQVRAVVSEAIAEEAA